MAALERAETDSDFLGVSGSEDVDCEKGVVIVSGSIEAVKGEGVGATAEDHLPAGEFVILVREGEASP